MQNVEITVWCIVCYAHLKLPLTSLCLLTFKQPQTQNENNKSVLHVVSLEPVQFHENWCVEAADH